MLKQYNVPVADSMRLVHDAQVRFTVRSGRRVLEDSLVDVEVLGGALTRCGIIYNRLSVSGGVAWWDPSTGQPISRPRITMLVRSDDVLTGDQECNCEGCAQ